MSMHETKSIVNEKMAERQRIKDSVEKEIILDGFHKEMVHL